MRSYHFRGSLCVDFEIDGIDLSDLIRDEIGIKNLYIFDENNKPDKVNKIKKIVRKAADVDFDIPHQPTSLPKRENGVSICFYMIISF